MKNQFKLIREIILIIKSAMYLNLIGTFAILCVCCLCGFVAFAFFYGCDPKLDGRITKYDQVFISLIINKLVSCFIFSI